MAQPSATHQTSLGELNKTSQLALRKGVDLERVPAHIALIMDGNGRWAQRRGLGRLIGHRQGYQTLRHVLSSASELGVRYLTVYAFSAENWRRPQSEVGGLFRLIAEAAKLELGELRKKNVQVRISGRKSEIPDYCRQALQDLEDGTKSNTGITFTLAVNYGGRAELVDAVRKLISDGIAADQVTEELISQALYQPDHPEPDLMIRTAGEMRWSNFLLWQSAYSELFVTERPWPEFGTEELIEGVLQYQKRTRKFGGLG